MALPAMPKRMSLADFVKNHDWNGVSCVEIGLFHKALHTAIRCHSGQKRLSGEAYYEHVLVVADTLRLLGFDIETQVMGLLHDVIEDSDITREEIEKEFGVRVANGVWAMSKSRNMPQITWKKLITYTKDDSSTIFAKMVDRWHNLTTVYDFRDLDRTTRYLEETKGPFCDTLHKCRQFVPSLYLSLYDELTVTIYTSADIRLKRITHSNHSSK